MSTPYMMLTELLSVGIVIYRPMLGNPLEIILGVPTWSVSEVAG